MRSVLGIKATVPATAGVLLLAASWATVALPAAAAAAGCSVDYTVTSYWDGGFGANVAITNLGDPISAWTLTWSFPGAQQVTQAWNTSLTQSGSQVTAKNVSYNGSIGTSATVSFGFNGSWSGSNPKPIAFTLNGVLCNGGSTPSSVPPSSVPPSSVPPSSVPPSSVPPSSVPPSSVPPSSVPPSSPPVSYPPGTVTTAWHDGAFDVDTPNVVRRSNLVLNRANTSNTQFVPFGNGSLGVSTWAGNGFTAQLNRNDTFPDRKSPGQVVIPGLSRMTGAADFKGYLDLYDGTLHESGGGMTLTAYVRADAPELVVDVTGADPNSTQTAQVKLWSGRTPTAQASGSVAALSQTWGDGNSGQTFGAMAAVSANGRNVTASTPNNLTGQVSFQPATDGSYRVIAVSPKWTGGNAVSTATSLLGSDLTKSPSALAASHVAWWRDYWNSIGLIKITSADGSGEYYENLRTLDLFYMASINRDTVPGTQAGMASLFSFSQDTQPWYPAAYWFWNLRMFVQGNLSSGAFSLNSPVFNLYRSNLSNIAAWTSANYPGHQGICVPETMRFNGNGSWYAGNESCDSKIAPSYNSQNVTTGAEIGLWVWQTYQATDDRAFLSANYPLIRDSARFLLSHAKQGSDGLLHTTSNAHETQWAVNDPITDIAAMRSLFPVFVQAAQTLGVDADVVGQVNAAIPKLRSFPTTNSGGATVFAASAQPSAASHNVENLGLEPVWPYNLIGDSGSQTQMARDTYARRPYPTSEDWTMDAIQAARLGLASEVKTAMSAATSKYQLYPAGIAAFGGNMNSYGPSPYLEQDGVLTAAMSEALVQDYDGVLRAAPAWPSGWDVDGTVFIQHRGKAHIQIRNGVLTTFAVDAGATGNIVVRNPWAGQNVNVVNGAGVTVLANQTGATFTIPAQSGTSYVIQRASAPSTSLPRAAVGGTPATAPKTLGSRTIGVR